MKQFRIAAAAAAATALALPAAAFGQGSVFAITAKVAVPGDPITLADQTRYVVSHHGFSYVLRESNQRTDHGMLNYEVAPEEYRNQPGFTRDRLIAETDTGAQPHATCEDDSLEDVAWPRVGDPIYNYVPFQTTSAGLGDDPADWLGDIEDLTGVDLTEVADPKAACETLGGVYHPADETHIEAADFAAGTIAAEKAPLEEQIATLTTAQAAAEAARAEAEAAQAAAEAARAAAEAGKATAEAASAAADRARNNALTQLADANAALAGSRSDAERYLLASAPVALDVFGTTKASVVASRGVSISVTGPALRPATVLLQVSRKRARAMGLTSRVLARKVTTIGAGGSTIVVIKPGRKVAKALRTLKGSLKVSVSAVSSSRDSATTTFIR